MGDMHHKVNIHGVTIQGGPKKTTPNFGGHFDILPEKFYNLYLDAIKGWFVWH